MKLFLYLIIGVFMLSSAKSDDNPVAYKIFDKDGEEVEYSDILDKSDDSDVILFGEFHNSAISHYLQFKLTKSIFEENDGKLTVGAEMFESDDQIIVDEYLKDQITENYFKKEAKLWDNYETDYKPVLEFVKEKKLDFIATNIPRRYAGYVARNGLEKLGLLSNSAHTYIAPLPVKFDPELPGYAALLAPMAMHGATPKKHGTADKKEMPKMMHKPKEDTTKASTGMDKMHSSMSPNMQKPNMLFIAQAQAVKDATMAYFILKNLKPDYKFLHLNGSYHSDNFEGISWYLKQDKPDVEIMTISTVEQESTEELEEENHGKADFIIVVDKDMTKTN